MKWRVKSPDKSNIDKTHKKLEEDDLAPNLKKNVKIKHKKNMNIEIEDDLRNKELNKNIKLNINNLVVYSKMNNIKEEILED